MRVTSPPMPRVEAVKRHVACHMGLWQPGQATPCQTARTLNSPEGDAIGIFAMSRGDGNVVWLSRLEQRSVGGMYRELQAPFNALQHTRSKAVNKEAILTAQMNHKPVEWVIAWDSDNPEEWVIAWDSGGIAGEAGHSHMPRERLRMCSRRGMSRGRSGSQRPEISPSSSLEITSEQNRPPGRNARGNCWGMPECGHAEHPAIRYRIPCAFANNTLIVSVTVEHCSSVRGRMDTVTVPRVDMETPTVDFTRPVQKDEAGPSEPVRRSSSPGREPVQRSSDKGKGVAENLKGPASDEPHSTDED